MPKAKKITTVVAAIVMSTTVVYHYSRSDYKHWIDADKDCQNTRQEVLIAESLEKVTLDQKGCAVVKGKWHDPYTDKYFTNPNDLDIDHFVPLGEVDRSGGHQWPKDKKMKYANDLSNPEVLIAVYKSANRAKGDKDPSDWLPPNKKFQCDYIKIWQKIKKQWALEMDQKEKDFISQKNKECKQPIIRKTAGK